MRPEDGGDGEVEVALWLVGVAKGAVGHDGGPELQVQQAALEVDKLAAEDTVGGRQRAARSEGGDAVEEDVGGDLEAAVGALEDVLRGEWRERLEGERQGEEGEEGEGVADGARDGADLEAGRLGGILGGAVVGYGAGDEDGAKEEEERFNTEGVSRAAWQGRISTSWVTHVPQGMAMMGSSVSGQMQIYVYSCCVFDQW